MSSVAGCCREISREASAAQGSRGHALAVDTGLSGPEACHPSGFLGAGTPLSIVRLGTMSPSPSWQISGGQVPGGGWAFPRPAGRPPGGEPRLSRECTARSSVPSPPSLSPRCPITGTPPRPRACAVAVRCGGRTQPQQDSGRVPDCVGGLQASGSDVSRPEPGTVHENDDMTRAGGGPQAHRAEARWPAGQQTRAPRSPGNGP